MVTSWHDYPAGITGITERDLLVWFRRHARPGETWLDIGAHYGYTAIALCQLVGPGGRVFAFEPVAATAGCLAQTKAINGLRQLTIVPSALGSDAATMELTLDRGMVDRTLAGGPLRRGHRIRIASLETLWPLVNDGRDVVHGVKIDVQGMELEALLGMRTILQRHHPKLVIELHRGVSRAALLDLLSTMDYSRTAVAIEGGRGDQSLADDRSYAFAPHDPRAARRDSDAQLRA